MMVAAYGLRIRHWEAEWFDYALLVKIFVFTRIPRIVLPKMAPLFRIPCPYTSASSICHL